MLELISQTANPSEKRIKCNERYCTSECSWLVAKSQTNRKRLKIPDFILGLWHFFEVLFFGCAKNEGNFWTVRKNCGKWPCSNEKKTETVGEKKWNEKKVKKRPAQQSTDLEWNCWVAGQVGDDIGLTGMSVYTASRHSFYRIIPREAKYFEKNA